MIGKGGAAYSLRRAAKRKAKLEVFPEASKDCERLLLTYGVGKRLQPHMIWSKHPASKSVIAEHLATIEHEWNSEHPEAAPEERRKMDLSFRMRAIWKGYKALSHREQAAFREQSRKQVPKTEEEMYAVIHVFRIPQHQ